MVLGCTKKQIVFFFCDNNSGVRNESDPALALLADHVESPSHAMRCGACVGLGVAYAGARREDVVELLTPLVANTEGANMVEVSKDDAEGSERVGVRMTA